MSVSRGDAGIVANWSSDGAVHVGETILMECRLHPIQSIKDTIEFVYDGLHGMAETLGSIPAARPDYADKSGEWEITGKILDKGAAIACRMERPSVDDQYSVGFFNIISPRAEKSSEQLIAATVDMKEGAKVVMILQFDHNPQIILHGIVQSGYATADFGETSMTAPDRSIADFVQRVTLLKTGKKLTIKILSPGKPTETVAVDLTGSGDALVRNGLCMKATIDLAIARRDGMAK